MIVIPGQIKSHSFKKLSWITYTFRMQSNANVLAFLDWWNFMELVVMEQVKAWVFPIHLNITNDLSYKEGNWLGLNGQACLESRGYASMPLPTRMQLCMVADIPCINIWLGLGKSDSPTEKTVEWMPIFTDSVIWIFGFSPFFPPIPRLLFSSLVFAAYFR